MRGDRTMERWIDELAEALGEEPLSSQEVDGMLETARDVAHRAERRVTPLSTFLLGTAVGRRMAAGASRADATDTALGALRDVLPDAPPGPPV
jgi:hypothetical protein